MLVMSTSAREVRMTSLAKETNGAFGQWYERRRMVRVDSGTRGDEWCVWAVVREETNGTFGEWCERRRMVCVDNGTRKDERCVCVDNGMRGDE
jgi:hypothetical protein